MGAHTQLLLATAGFDPTNMFIQFGVVGALALAGAWFAKGTYQDLKDRVKQLETDLNAAHAGFAVLERERERADRERDRADRMEAESQRLYGLVIDRALPALLGATRAAEQTAEMLRGMQREREHSELTRRLTAQLKKGADNAGAAADPGPGAY